MLKDLCLSDESILSLERGVRQSHLRMNHYGNGGNAHTRVNGFLEFGARKCVPDTRTRRILFFRGEFARDDERRLILRCNSHGT